MSVGDELAYHTAGSGCVLDATEVMVGPARSRTIVSESASVRYVTVRYSAVTVRVPSRSGRVSWTDVAYGRQKSHVVPPSGDTRISRALATDEPSVTVRLVVSAAPAFRLFVPDGQGAAGVSSRTQ